MAAMPDQIEPFVISVAGAALDDLRDRLGRTRWPEREPVGDWPQGVPLDYLRDLCGYWAKRYDWRATEARLNQIPPRRSAGWTSTFCTSARATPARCRWS